MFTKADVGLLEEVLPSVAADLQRDGKRIDLLFEKPPAGNEEMTWPTFLELCQRFGNGRISRQQTECL